MKVEEVPQDGAFLIEGKIRDVCYVVDKNGRYTQVLSKGWAPKNEAMQLAWDKIYEKAEETRKLVLEGRLSPIALYMELNIMDISILAGYMNLPRRKVKRHLKMKGFRTLTPELINQYAETLNVTPAELVDVNRIREIVFVHEA